MKSPCQIILLNRDGDQGSICHFLLLNGPGLKICHYGNNIWQIAIQVGLRKRTKLYRQLKISLNIAGSGGGTVDLSNYYNKPKTDGLFSPLYDSGEVDNFFNGILNVTNAQDFTGTLTTDWLATNQLDCRNCAENTSTVMFLTQALPYKVQSSDLLALPTYHWTVRRMFNIPRVVSTQPLAVETSWTLWWEKQRDNGILCRRPSVSTNLVMTSKNDERQ